MPETLRYSVVAAVQTMWLAARAEGLGMGWVSILDPAEVTRALDVPEGWRLVAYLDLGWPAEEHIDPELERHHWEAAPLHRRSGLHALTICGGRRPIVSSSWQRRKIVMGTFAGDGAPPSCVSRL